LIEFASQHVRPLAIGEPDPKKQKSPPSDINLNDRSEEIIGTRDGPVIMYSYKRPDGTFYNTWEKLHEGGKRKSRRNRKSKKSRKNLRKSRKNLRKSNRRR
jgi:hypothetical protein